VRDVPFAVVVNARQRVLELDDGARRVSSGLLLAVPVVSHQFSDSGKRLSAGADQVEAVAVVVDTYVRHRIPNPAHGRTTLHVTHALCYWLAA